MDGNAAVRRERGGRQSSAAGRSENLGSGDGSSDWEGWCAVAGQCRHDLRWTGWTMGVRDSGRGGRRELGGCGARCRRDSIWGFRVGLCIK